MLSLHCLHELCNLNKCIIIIIILIILIIIIIIIINNNDIRSSISSSSSIITNEAGYFYTWQMRLSALSGVRTRKL